MYLGSPVKYEAKKTCREYLKSRDWTIFKTKPEAKVCLDDPRLDRPAAQIHCRFAFNRCLCEKGYYCPPGKTAQSYGEDEGVSSIGEIITGEGESGGIIDTIKQYWYIGVLLGGIILYKKFAGD